MEASLLGLTKSIHRSFDSFDLTLCKMSHGSLGLFPSQVSHVLPALFVVFVL